MHLLCICHFGGHGRRFFENLRPRFELGIPQYRVHMIITQDFAFQTRRLKKFDKIPMLRRREEQNQAVTKGPPK
jgi:hypothetical protein